MQEPRFHEGDYVKVVRIFPADMGLEGDLQEGLYDEYCRDLLGSHGAISSIEEKWKKDDTNFFVYEVELSDADPLFFHEGELALYAKPKI
jgi:hypothetical protein